MVRPRPFLKWAGGKSRISQKIATCFPRTGTFRRYFEPFLGSGAVYFEIAPQEGFLSDLNKSLIDTYVTVKENPEELIDLLRGVEEIYNSLQCLDEKEAFYYDIRNNYNSLSEKNILLKSAYFIFLNKAGWNGMYRENAEGDFNIPFGKRMQLKCFDEQNIMSVSKNIKNMQFMAGDYKETVNQAARGDLIYFDPPYFPVSKTANFTAYQKEGFGDEEQRELFELAKELSRKGCYVAISNSSTKEARNLYESSDDFYITTIPISRTIGSKSTSRKKVDEILATNYKIEDIR